MWFVRRFETMWRGSTINFANVVIMCQQKALSPSAVLTALVHRRWIGQYMLHIGTYPQGAIAITQQQIIEIVMDFLSRLILWDFFFFIDSKKGIFIIKLLFVKYIGKNHRKVPTSWSFQIWNIHQPFNPKKPWEKPESQSSFFEWSEKMRLRTGPLPIHVLWTSTHWISPPINAQTGFSVLRIFVRSYAPRWSIPKFELLKL